MQAVAPPPPSPPPPPPSAAGPAVADPPAPAPLLTLATFPVSSAHQISGLTRTAACFFTYLLITWSASNCLGGQKKGGLLKAEGLLRCRQLWVGEDGGLLQSRCMCGFPAPFVRRK